ncbi:MAG: hypothetical protein JRM73_05065 [Nitrososphaerota archaeon]|nr:hypothetical protein [Nitrososphaerota archaeon]
MVNAFFLPNSLLSLIGGLVALAVSYFAHRYGRVAGGSFLRILSLGFMLLGIGLIAQASAFLFFFLDAGKISDRGVFVYGGTIIYLVLQSIAYLLIAVSYARRMQTGAVTAATAGVVVLLQNSPFLIHTYLLEFGELVLATLVALIVFQALLVYEDNKNRLSLMVLGAFSAILVAHLAKLSSSVLASGLLYLIGGIIELGGFGLLLLFVLRSGPDGRN